MASSSLPQVQRVITVPGGTGNPYVDSSLAQRQAAQSLLNLQKSVSGGSAKRRKGKSRRCYCRRCRRKIIQSGGDTGSIPVTTIPTMYKSTLVGPSNPVNQQLHGLQNISRMQVQGANDKVSLITGGRARSRSRKTKRFRKLKSTRKQRLRRRR
jgi:hypothetical protein